MLCPSIVNFTSHEQAQGLKIPSPASGKIDAIDGVDVDEQDTFVLSMMGQGVAITIDSKDVVSPIKGRVLEWHPSLGKVVIQAANKLRFLIQLPFSYSVHHGLGITSHIREGQIVEVNQPLMTLDLYKIQLVQKPIVLFFILLDHKLIKSIDVFNKRVSAGVDVVFFLVPKPKPKATNKPAPAAKGQTAQAKKAVATQSKLQTQNATKRSVANQSKPIQKNQGK